jgi:hypothetical protein
VTLSSAGTSELKVTTIRVEGPNATSFTPSGNCAAGGTVAPGASCTIDVTFARSVGGTLACEKATLVVRTDDPGTPEHRIGLIGRGLIELTC